METKNASKICLLDPKGCGKSFSCFILYLQLNKKNKLYLTYNSLSDHRLITTYLQHFVNENELEIELEYLNCKSCITELISDFISKSKELFLFIDFGQITEKFMYATEILIKILLLPCRITLSFLSSQGKASLET